MEWHPRIARALHLDHQHAEDGEEDGGGEHQSVDGRVAGELVADRTGGSIGGHCRHRAGVLRRTAEDVADLTADLVDAVLEGTGRPLLKRRNLGLVPAPGHPVLEPVGDVGEAHDPAGDGHQEEHHRVHHPRGIADAAAAEDAADGRSGAAGQLKEEESTLLIVIIITSSFELTWPRPQTLSRQPMVQFRELLFQEF